MCCYWLLVIIQENVTLDINECAEGTDRCEQNCQNTRGSYYCFCDTGFRLARNRYDCDGKWYWMSSITHIDHLVHFQILMSVLKEYIPVHITVIMVLEIILVLAMLALNWTLMDMNAQGFQNLFTLPFSKILVLQFHTTQHLKLLLQLAVAIWTLL